MAGGNSWNSDFAVATLDHYIAAAVKDQVFDEHALLAWIEKQVRFDRIAGGDNILIPLGTAEDANGGSYSGYDTFDTDPAESLANAFYNWKSYQQPIIAPAREILRNKGRSEGVLDMLMAKTDVAMASLRSKLNTHAFADGTGNSSKNILGLSILVDSAGTVGGLARATAPYWQANETAVGGALRIDTSVGMLRMYNNCSTGSGDGARPDMIFTDQDEYEAYENLLAPDIRHTQRSVGDGTFSGLAFKGVPIQWDADATAGIMYFLRASAFSAWIHPDRDFFHTKPARAEDGTLQQDAWISHILLWPEFAINEPRRTGKLSGLND